MARTETAPKTSPAIEAFVRLVRASFAVTRQLSGQLSDDHDLNLNAYEALLLTASGVTRLLDGLERDGFVGREQCESDRRVTYAVLTKAGRDKLREADKSHTRQIRELMGAHYDDDELVQLAALLDRLAGVDPADASCGDES